MASQTIPNLPAATSVGGTEQIWAVQNGVDVRLTSAQIAGIATISQGVFNSYMSAWLAGLPNVRNSGAGVIPGTGQPYINASGYLVLAA